MLSGGSGGLGPCGQGLSVQTAHELMHRIVSRLPHACAIWKSCAATHTYQNLLEGSVPVLGTADCAVSRIPPRGLWLHTRLARVERGIEIVQVPISHIDMRKETIETPMMNTCMRSGMKFVARPSAPCSCNDKFHLATSENAALNYG